MSFLAILRAYSLREYGVVLAMAVLGGLGLVFMLSTMGGGAPAGETVLKRDATEREPTASLRFVEANAAAKARARAAAARRAKILTARREILAARAARAARRAARSAPARQAVRRAPSRVVAPAPTRIVNTTPAPSRPTPRPAPAPAPKPAPQQSGSGGGGSFDDSG